MEPSDVSASEGLQERCPAPSEISLVIDSLEKQVASNRCIHIKRKMEENWQKMIEVTKNMFRSSQERRCLKCSNTDTIVDVLTKRQNYAIDMQNGESIGQNDENNSQEDVHHSAVILLGSSIEVKNAVRPVKLTEVKRLPPYITWTFLDRNQKMHEDKSVRQRRIYYDKSWGETLVASDSDEEAIDEDDEKKETIDEDDEKKEAIDEDEEKKEFVDSEDYILRMTINKVGLSDAVLDVLAQRFSRKPCEVKARYEVLTNRENAAGGSQNWHREAISSSLLDKDLNAALHSFDNLFCRRCFVFNCGLHGCSKDPIFPAEKQLPWSCPDEGNVPCGLHCYRLISKSLSAVPSLSRGKPGHIESATSNAIDVSESSDSESRPIIDLTSSHPSPSPTMIKLVEKCGIDKRNSKRLAEHGVVTMRKRKKKLTTSYSDSLPSLSWKAMEKALYKKGVEIFGRNSCLIARNIMQDTKTCSDVFEFMNSSEENNLFSEAGNALDSLTEGCSIGDGNENMGAQLRRRSRFFRRRGRVRRLKYTSKSTGYHSFRKRISEDKNIHHYSPCACQSACGKECFCFLNKTCCEKYCGCPRSCKNRFRGCHCAKSQCRSRQCPCYAARRECDPDVCRNCWISCGDGTLGVPNQKGDNYECGNMQLLLKQQQKVLLGRSDVSGWGVFLKNSVEKNEYIGEYTGELVSQHEADKRGKIYDRVNSSYLFNLNNQYVLDAFRKGNKLKFANHSFDPNCYAKVLMVAGDHRVGIFAKQQICAGEEIFYNYGYDDDIAPDWIKKLKASGSKKDEHTPSSG